MADAPYGISPMLVERFKTIFSAFVKAVNQAVTEAAQKPEFSQAPSFHSWQSKALPLLQKSDAAIQAAAEAFEKGDAQPILTQAEDKQGLAKDLDGFPLTFAGPEHADKLDQLETAVVVAAYQICAAAGIS